MRTYLVCWLLALLFTPQQKENVKVHPTVYMTPEDVKRAKENVARFMWAKETADAIVREANTWLAKDDQWVLNVVPPAGACFAYGFTGCPICGASWGTWGGARASFDKPGHVTCANGHILPDAEHPDKGTGYVGKDGRIHYFVGSYHAWVVETLTFKAADNLAYAYTLTGDERYAAKAALILDALAAIYPTCDKGSWDYPSNPPSGRFNRPWYQVARVLVHYVDQYDQIYNSKSLDTPSLKAGLSKRQNIEENLLKNGAAYCYEQSLKGALHNGEADYIRGALAVGVCLNIPEYVRWAVEGPYGIYSLIENNIDRDGGYYETSMMYADHTRDLYFTFAEPLLNYRGSAYPHGVNLYQHPKFRRFFQLHNLAQTCAGHTPRYGDSAPDVAKADAPARPFDRNDYNFLERLYARTGEGNREIGKLGNEEERGLAALLRWLANGAVDKRRAESADKRWLLFHARPLPEVDAPVPADLLRRLTGCEVMGQKGIGILRAGEQALLLRFGPTLNHGHLDDLNFNYFARGYELTYDLGYGLGSTHTQVGWAKQTASHNLVVVNETSQAEDGQSGGSLHLFADLPTVKVIEASSESSYAAQGVTLYRRLMALIGEVSSAYLLDVFRVNGGKQHDYVFHALGDKVDFTGVHFGAEERGSLAGAEISWGDKQLNDGDIAGYPNKPYWNPPPGNGYGFLIKPQRGKPDGAWSADWRIDDATRLRMTAPASPDTEIITALAPGIYPRLPQSRYVLARRKGGHLSSQFIAAIEPYSETPQIKSVERLNPNGVQITRSDGATDFVFFHVESPTQTNSLRYSGKFAHVRVKDGQTISLALVGGKEFAGFGWRVKPQRDAWHGTVTAVDVTNNVITTTAPLPTDGSLDGHIIIFSHPRYSRTTAYRIVRVEEAGNQRRVHLHSTVVLGKGQVDKVADAQTLTSLIPHEYAHSVRRSGDSGFFRGKRIRAASGASTNIVGTSYGQPMTLKVENTQGFKPGDVFYYEDVQAGDHFEIATVLSLTQTAPNRYRISGNVRADVTAPDGVQVE